MRFLQSLISVRWFNSDSPTPQGPATDHNHPGQEEERVEAVETGGKPESEHHKHDEAACAEDDRLPE